MAKRVHSSASHPLLKWWRSLDHVNYSIIGFLMCFGLAMVMLASAGVTDTYSLESNAYYFAKKQLVFVLVAFPLLTLISTFNPERIKKVGAALVALATICIFFTLVSGEDVKGASRWVRIFGFSLQPTELMKPGLIIVTAWLLSVTNEKEWVKRFFASIAVMAVVCGLTILQPDFGMVIMFGTAWMVQAFLSGMPLNWVLGMITVAVTGILSAYALLPHVKSRVERFLDASSGDTYQVDQAREALLSGGLLGRGPGEGVVKHHLPDAHTDFIFAVIAEEFGIIMCLAVLFVYGVFVVRAYSAILDEKDRFVLLAGFGLITTFAMQTLVNICVVLNLMPTTGMTLPFISYGGSAMLGLTFTVGFILALTRKRGKKIV